MNNWTPIELIENKEGGRSVLLLNGGFPVVGYWEETGWVDNRECMTLDRVTHFCEIPPRPEGWR